MDWLEEHLNSIVLGDCYKLIKNIPDKSVDCIYTDPPYDIVTGGGKNIQKIRDMFGELVKNNLVDGFDINVLKEFMRIMKKPNIYIWCNKNIMPLLIKYFVLDNDCHFDIIMWHKKNALPMCGNKYLSDTEYCMYFRKNIRLNTTYETASTHYDLPINLEDKKTFKHPTVKPYIIVKNAMINSTNEGDIIFDPFSGSGTTCVASKELNRHFIGIEINEKWHKISVDRLNGITASGQTSIFTDFGLENDL